MWPGLYVRHARHADVSEYVCSFVNSTSLKLCIPCDTVTKSILLSGHVSLWHKRCGRLHWMPWFIHGFFSLPLLLFKIKLTRNCWLYRENADAFIMAVSREFCTNRQAKIGGSSSLVLKFKVVFCGGWISVSCLAFYLTISCIINQAYVTCHCTKKSGVGGGHHPSLVQKKTLRFNSLNLFVTSKRYCFLLHNMLILLPFATMFRQEFSPVLEIWHPAV